MDGENGIVGGHAYTVLACYELTTDNGKVRLVKMRNPWGVEQYTGPWSDESELWTDAYRQEVEKATGHASERSNNGIFYMDIESFHQSFYLTQINEDTSNWHFDYFLKLND